jgi:ABC-type multidrug transport system fused ATPase/permease subunit
MKNLLLFINYLKFNNKSLKLSLIITFIISVICALFELLSASFLYPLLSRYFNNQNKESTSEELLSFIEIYSGFNIFIFYFLILTLTLILRIYSNFVINKFCFDLGSDVSLKLYKIYINMNYEDITLTNSSILIDNIVNKSRNIIFDFLLPLMNIINSLFVSFLLLILLLYIDYVVTILMLSIVTTFYFLIVFAVRKKLYKNSFFLAEFSIKIVKIIRETIGSIKEVKLNRKLSNTQELNFQFFDIELRRHQLYSTFIGTTPRPFIEYIGTLLVLIILIYNINSNIEDLYKLLPLIAVIVYVIQKIVPLFNLIYLSYTTLISNNNNINQILVEVSKPYCGYADYVNYLYDFDFKSIEFIGVYFKYKNKKEYVLKDINIKIEKGDFILINGISGKGKSTFLDILTTLLDPTSGRVLLNDVIINKNLASYFKNKIAYVPQNIFLYDNTLIYNITLCNNFEDINYSLLNEIIECVGLEEIIQNLSSGMNTSLGERGVAISGGQKQRVAIARALYSLKEIIILDESTNAIDKQGEELLFENMITKFTNKLTFIIVNHGSINNNIIFNKKLNL